MSDTLFEMPLEPAGVPRGRAMIERAEWAARAFASYDAATVQRIVDAAAAAGAARAEELAAMAVRETGFGVAEHKVLKNRACSAGVAAAYRAADFVEPVIDAERKIVAVPRPAGVILALTPSTNPVATVYFKILLALLTRNAIVISPHPFAKGVCVEAARTMAEAAVAAGAPDGCVQVVEEPSIPLVNALMTDPRTDVIVATGGTPMVRAAYRSGNPAIGVGPGNVPVLVDATADLAAAAKLVIDSKSFDNSILCTNESVLIVEEKVADRLVDHLQRAGAHLLSDADRDKVRALTFPDGHLDTQWIGKDATEIAKAAGVRVQPRTRVLLAPFDLVVPEEMLAHEKLFPVLGFVRVPTASRGIDAARAVLRITGEGHSAAIHSTDARTIMEYSAAVRVLRVSVNVGNSLGSSGLATGLAPSMTIGTGFFGRSSVGENLEPKHLVNWTRIAYNSDASVPMPDFSALTPWQEPVGAVPPYPRASNDGGAPLAPPPAADALSTSPDGELREEIRRLIIEELNAIGGAEVAELRSFIFLDRLQPQTMSYLGTWVRGALPRADVAAQIIEVAPGLDIEPLTDVALKYAEVQAGILVVERQFGYLEIHGPTGQVKAAGEAVLDALGTTQDAATRPQVLASRIVTMLDRQHAFLINRNKIGSMALPGESLFVLEMAPASYAILATNEAEKAAAIKVVDYRMIGATGRVYLAGKEGDVRQAAEAAEAALRSVG